MDLQLSHWHFPAHCVKRSVIPQPFLVLMVPAINVVFFVDVSFKGLHAATLVDELCSYCSCLSLEKETETSVKLHVHINNITLM